MNLAACFSFDEADEGVGTITRLRSAFGRDFSGFLVRTEQRDPGIPVWFPESYGQFRSRLAESRYPCFYGTVAEKNGDLFVGYAGGEDDVARSAELLSTFLDVVTQRRLSRSIFALFFVPEESHDLAHYQRKFWRLLAELGVHDDHPAAAGEPDSKEWEFVFHGEPMFVFAVCPAYERRRSRNMGPSFVVLFQPRVVFGVLGDADGSVVATPRREIRRRSVEWDGMATHPDLGIYGSETNREWKSYFLPDNVEPVTGSCPLGAMKQPAGEA